MRRLVAWLCLGWNFLPLLLIFMLLNYIFRDPLGVAREKRMIKDVFFKP